jgi:hypothetical protein
MVLGIDEPPEKLSVVIKFQANKYCDQTWFPGTSAAGSRPKRRIENDMAYHDCVQKGSCFLLERNPKIQLEVISKQEVV